MFSSRPREDFSPSLGSWTYIRDVFELIGPSCNIKLVKTSQHFKLSQLFKDKLKIAVKKKIIISVQGETLYT